jgi:hypothetical protein
VTLFVGCAAPALLGCHTAIGAGIGAVIPKYERGVPPSDESLTEGTAVRVMLKPEVAGAEKFDGDYVGMQDDKLTLQMPTQPHLITIPKGQIGEVQKRLGSYWLEGLLIGAVVDAGIMIAGLIVLHNDWPPRDAGPRP